MKYSKIFNISFISYILIIFAGPYVTAQTWADICMFLFCSSLLYQLVFIFYLRKKENIKLGKCIAKYFLLALSSVSIYIIIDYIDIFINGVYISNGFFSDDGNTYYGIEAIINAWNNIFYIPWLIINSIYCHKYFKHKR